ncbi:MAG TPA: PPC domain-containing DNA-binding protein [Candidatus Bilamarchaeum sp.]|nr:PPC domain-containing DNA-binding protein [Candidatus Bilamarchaeum sp.]
MEYKRGSNRVVLRLDDGDEIVASLKAVCRKEGIESALVSGIGAARKAELAHFDTKEKKYNTKKFEGMLEIVSLSGNIALLKGEAVPHIHMCISRHDFSTISGHLMSAEIYPTCEIVIIPHGIRVERRFDEKTGLNLQGF